MEKLKSIAKSIRAKIPKTKTEFKDLFDKCVSYYEEHKAWIHRLCLGIIIALWGFILLAMLFNFFTLYFSGDETPNRASEVRLAVFTLTAWIGAPFLVWRTMIAAEQTKAAEQQAETAQEQAQIAQEKAYTELFTNAVEQLGSIKPVGKDKYEVNIEVRVGALYALERIMHDSDKDAKTIIDTLCTYVKHNCGKSKILEKKITLKNVLELQEHSPSKRYDIQTALKIIARRPEKNKSEKDMPDLTIVNLQGANLASCDLSFCNLAHAHLDGVDLQWADLQWADLLGADLQAAVLRGAKLLGADLLLANITEVQIDEANTTAASVAWVDFTKSKYDFDTLQEQLPNMYGHKTLTILPKGMKVPDHWFKADMDTDEGMNQYYAEWEAFKKEMGVR